MTASVRRRGFLVSPAVVNAMICPHRLISLAAAAVLVTMSLVRCASALPPLGLTPLGESGRTTGLSIVQGNAYISSFDGSDTTKFFVVATDGSISTIEVVHPTLGSFAVLSNPVETVDGELYFTGSNLFMPTGGALYRLDSLPTPVATWEGPYFIAGVDRNLRVYGHRSEAFLDGTPLEFDPVSLQISPLTTGSFVGNARVGLVTPSGYLVGGWQFPGTEEFLTAYWDPEGSFYQTDHTIFRIEERADGIGLNMGLSGPSIKYGDADAIRLTRSNGDVLPAHSVIPTGTELAIIDFGRFNFVYYPGIVPDTPGAAKFIEEVFPQLDGVDFSDGIDRVFATEGRVYMTFISDGQAYLFGALDPSLAAVPEPSTLAGLTILAFAALGASVRRGRRRRASMLAPEKCAPQ